MDIQKMFDNVMKAERAEEMKTSTQLMLGELILKLEAIADKDLPVTFDGKWHPTDVDSWRGSYCELSIEYECGVDVEMMTLAAFLSMLKDAIGTTFEGYKGGDFVMGKNTPVWVANYGTSIGFKRDADRDYQAVVDVLASDKVYIQTEPLDY